MGGGRASSSLSGQLAVALRRARPADIALEFELFTAGHEGAVLFEALGAEHAMPLVEMQFRAREAAWSRAWPAAERSIITADGVDVGRVLFVQGDDELRLIDLAVAPAWRGQAIATTVLADFVERSAAAGVPLRLAVLVTNHHAQRLYQRIGFVEIGRDATHVQLERRR